MVAKIIVKGYIISMPKNSHFTDKAPLEHVAEKLAEGKLTSIEVHGTELPGHLSAGADAARETAVFLLLIGSILFSLKIPPEHLTVIIILLATGWIIWKFGSKCVPRSRRLHYGHVFI